MLAIVEQYQNLAPWKKWFFPSELEVLFADAQLTNERVAAHFKAMKTASFLSRLIFSFQVWIFDCLSDFKSKLEVEYRVKEENVEPPPPANTHLNTSSAPVLAALSTDGDKKDARKPDDPPVLTPEDSPHREQVREGEQTHSAVQTSHSPVRPTAVRLTSPVTSPVIPNANPDQGEVGRNFSPIQGDPPSTTPRAVVDTPAFHQEQPKQVRDVAVDAKPLNPLAVATVDAQTDTNETLLQSLQQKFPQRVFSPSGLNANDKNRSQLAPPKKYSTPPIENSKQPYHDKEDGIMDVSAFIKMRIGPKPEPKLVPKEKTICGW